MPRRCPARSAMRSAALSKRGGSVVATFASSLCDEAGDRRDGFRPRRSLWRAVHRPRRRADAELVSQPRRRSQTGRRHPVLDGLDAAPRIINGAFRLDVMPTVDVPVAGHADSHLSRSADGGRLSARRAHRHARALSAPGRHGPRGLHPVGYRSHILGDSVAGSRPAAAKRGDVGTRRAARGGGRRPGASGRQRLAAARSRSRFIWST